MSRENIANVLKRLRTKTGYTANEIGEMIGKSGKTVNAWENNRGQPDAEMLIRLCDIYQVDDILSEFKNAILDGDDKKEKPVTSDDGQEKEKAIIDNFIDTLDEKGLKQFEEIIDAIASGETDMNKLYQMFLLVSDK